MAASRISRQPSPYPRIPFHLIRLVQFISSIVVLSVISYFVYYLIKDNYGLPWTFILLLTLSALTPLSILITTVLYFTRSLQPRTSLFTTIPLSALWIVMLGLLTWNLWGLLGNRCDISNWNHDTGVAVCLVYKGLYAFSVITTLSTLSALLLDISTSRSQRRRGAYNNLGIGLPPTYTPNNINAPYTPYNNIPAEKPLLTGATHDDFSAAPYRGLSVDLIGSEEREAREERELGRGGYERVQRLDRSPSPYRMTH